MGHADKVDPKLLEETKNKYKHTNIAQWFLDPLSKKFQANFLSNILNCRLLHILISHPILRLR